MELGDEEEKEEGREGRKEERRERREGGRKIRKVGSSHITQGLIVHGGNLGLLNKMRNRGQIDAGEFTSILSFK